MQIFHIISPSVDRKNPRTYSWIQKQFLGADLKTISATITIMTHELNTTDSTIMVWTVTICYEQRIANNNNYFGTIYIYIYVDMNNALFCFNCNNLDAQKTRVAEILIENSWIFFESSDPPTEDELNQSLLCIEEIIANAELIGSVDDNIRNLS